MFKTIIRFLSLLVFLFFTQLTVAQLSKKHFIPPLTSSDGFSDQFIYISTPKNGNVAYKITPVGNPDLPAYSGVVSKNNPVQQSVLDLSGNVDNNDDSQLHVRWSNILGVINDRGFIIEAEDVIYVSVRVRSSGPNKFHAGALVSKGNSALGKQFRIGGFVKEGVSVNNHITFASIMATEDATSVTISNLPSNVSIINYSGPIPITFTLNEGESYIIAAQTNVSNGADAKDIIGALISSDKNIVVNSGSAFGSFANPNGNVDYGFDQIVDAKKIGTEYILVRGAGNNEFENALVIAHENNTDVQVGGNSIITLNAGEYLVIEGNSYSSSGNMYIKTSKPSFVYQGVGGTDSPANQGLFFVPPLSCENIGDVDNIALIDQVDNSGSLFIGGVTIVTNIGANVTINGNDIRSINGSQGPFNVTGNSGYVTYKVTGLTGNISVSSDQELYCAYFNASGAAASGAFYSGFPSAPEINFETTVASLGSCIPNVTLEAANTDIFDSFEWQYFNEISGLWEFRSNNPSYKPLDSEPGKYKLIGIVNCTGATFESVEIPVSICPDDFDGDLIIDNLDVDLDNDGILNSIESLGNAAINLSDKDNPQIIFQDSTTNLTIISSVYTSSEASNTFTGQNTGDFVSVVNPAQASNEIYELNFTQKINFLFRQSITGNHVINEGEYFIIKIGPSNKNITLLDPNDQLLIDTNFDGEFEPNVTSISASEIRFKYKANLAGNQSTFQFVANQVEQIIFEHHLTGANSSSTFNGFIQLTTFAKDSDGDGIEDMFDVDSDNDGIPDVFEASATKITLSGIDANLDGLDDVFNGITTGIDTDGDGIPNYLDVDADNDGIFDLVEAGHGNLDANNDGILDNANASNVGINGLLNSLETTIDAKILSLNYTISDTDADNIFNFLELDSDNDECFDVIEAGFTGTPLGILSATPFQVSANGKVINNANGYTIPNPDYITIAPIILNTPFENNVFCENSTDVLSIDSNADTFQWEVSTDNGANWITIVDNTVYAGSTTKDLQITNPAINFNNYQFRVVLNRTGNACGKTSNTIILTVNPEPVTQDEVDLLQCDDDLDRISTINLTEAEISISANYQNETFTYFATQADAIAGTPEVADKLRYPVNQTGEAWVRTISADGCYRISKINLQVDASADVTYNKEFDAVCDDFLQADGTSGALNNDTDGITNFDFSIANSEILAFFPANLQPDLEVSFFETNDDRTAVINKIGDISNYRNTNFPSNVIRQTIYFKITNKNNNDCAGTGELYLRTNAVPVANPASDLELCDEAIDGDATNGIVQNFDLESQTLVILGTQNPADFTVTYHLNKADTETGNNPISSPFTNTIRDLQTIFVRVTNNATGCFTNHTSFNVIVNPIPIANFVADLEVCDDNADGSARNGFSQSIDLESQTAGILGTQDPTIHTITYHRSLADAQNGNNPLVSPYSNSTPNRETIYVRVLNNNSLCVNGISNFDVIINPEPTFEPPTNLAYCDNDDDGDDTNSIIQNIDLESKISEILGTSQSPNDFTVTFHASQVNATNGISPIFSPYTNTNSTERIFVRIENKRTGCINDDAFFDVIVNPLPSFTVTSPQILCLNDLPLNISVENPMDIYTYEWKNEAGIVVGTSDNINITSGGNYFVTATSTNGTLCSRTEMIEVNESNIATLQNSFVTIIDESTNIGSQNNLSISIDVISNNLGPGEYQFAIVNTDTNERFPFAGFQDEPLFENLEGGIYQIIVNDKNGCSPDATLLVSVIQFPKFFTPNGDGENDTWVVKGANRTFYPNASINIFNRYGKLVAQVPIDSQGWNGTYNGTLLPSDDYWYNITLIPADTTKPTINKKGNFSLLRK